MNITIPVPQSPPELPASVIVTGAAQRLGWVEDNDTGLTATEFLADYLADHIWVQYQSYLVGVAKDEGENNLPRPPRRPVNPPPGQRPSGPPEPAE